MLGLRLTDCYAAPKVLMAPETANDLSDMYALGCCVYTMATGNRPFHDWHDDWVADGNYAEVCTALSLNFLPNALIC
jgi:serine/threonine protein kinase